MKRKAPLSMMELMVMIAVFALAAALCLRAFVKSDQISRRAEDRDNAAVLCQSVAELIQHEKGGLALALEKVSGVEVSQRDGFGFFVHYDEDWKALSYQHQEDDPAPSGVRAYTLRVMELESVTWGMERAQVETYAWNNRGEMESLFSLEVSWQKEVTPRG